ncbi:MAG: nucleotidyltransferase family protein [bacterium]
MTKTQDQKPKTDGVAAIILAAGQSSRMGAFKPLLPFGGKTVIDCTIDYLRRGGIETIIVVVGHRAADIKKQLDNSGVMFATNSDPNSAMAASIICGLRAVANDARALVITPVDHPAVPHQVVTQLINEWRAGARLVIPTNLERGGHPVLVDLSFRAELLKLDPARGLKSFFDAHHNQVKRVAVDSNYIARDLDTWDDYRSLHRKSLALGHQSRFGGRTYGEPAQTSSLRYIKRRPTKTLPYSSKALPGQLACGKGE